MSVRQIGPSEPEQTPKEREAEENWLAEIHRQISIQETGCSCERDKDGIWVWCDACLVKDIERHFWKEGDKKQIRREARAELDLELDNMGLMGRIGLHGKSRDEIKQIIKDEEKKKDASS